MEKFYIRHLIECQCVLKLYEKNTVPVYHKFPVFSITDDAGNVESKYVACNNCQIIHFVEEPFKSEIQWGKEGIKSYVRSIEDIKFNIDEDEIPDKIITLLEKEQCDVSTWEQLEFIVDNNIDGAIIKISEEDLGSKKNYKFLLYENKKFKLKTEIMQKDIDIRK